MATTIVPVSSGANTLQAAWDALPSTIAVGDIYVLELAAGVYSNGLNCTGKTVNGRVIVRPATGAAWYEAASPVTRYDSTKGVAIGGAGTGVSMIAIGQNVTLDGLQITGGGSNGVIGAASNRTGCEVKRCIIYAASADFRPIFMQGTFPALIANNVIIQDASSTPQPAISITDTSSPPDIINNTIIRPSGGGGAWYLITSGSTSRIVNNAIFGMSATVATVGASSNNATNNATVCGTSGVVNLTTANQFNNVTLAALDVRPKAGSGLVAGVTSGLVTTDVFGAARASTPTIGAIEYSVAAATPVSSDLAGGYSILSSGAVSSSLSGSYGIKSSVSASLAGSYSAAAATGSITTELWENNAGTAWTTETANYSWYPGGRVGSFAGITPIEGSKALVGGVLAVSGLPLGPGLLLGTVRGANIALDSVYLQPLTAA